MRSDDIFILAYLALVMFAFGWLVRGFADSAAISELYDAREEAEQRANFLFMALLQRARTGMYEKE
jgi:hypothetical protein